MSEKPKDYHTPLWWDFWKKEVIETRRKEPIQASVNAKIFKLSKIDLNTLSFSARVLVQVWVENEQLDSAIGMESQRMKHSTFYGYVIDKDMQPVKDVEPTDGSESYKFVAQFHPKIIFPNLLVQEYQSEWIRTKERDNCTLYNIEVQGSFSAPLDTSWYPLDGHRLEVEISSDWSTEYMLLSPHHVEQRNSLEREYNKALERQYYVGNGVAVEQKPESEGSPKNDDPDEHYKYSELTAAVTIRRRAGIMVFFMFSRPLLLTILCLSSFAFPADTLESLSSRLNLIIGLLLSISLALLYKKEEFFSFQDYVVAVSYIFIASITVETALLFFFLSQDGGQNSSIADTNVQIDETVFFVVAVLVSMFIFSVTAAVFCKSIICKTPHLIRSDSSAQKSAQKSAQDVGEGARSSSRGTNNNEVSVPLKG